jgi:HEPN domain-containing protein
MPERSRDWFRQAEYDLEKAKLDLQWRYYEWACFTAHQATEQAVKAVYDRFYIPTRYPNGLPAGVPHAYFSEEDAIKAIEAAEVILAWSQGFIPRS